MASPAEIAQGLPETLPEDFGEWDSGSRPAAVPGNSGGLETAPGLGEIPKPSGQPTEREATLAPVLDRPRDARSPSSPNGVRNKSELKPTVIRKADAPLFQPFPPHIVVMEKQKTPRKKWMIVAAVGACSILLLLMVMIRLFNPGTKSMAKQSVEPHSGAADTQPSTNTPKPSPSKPLIQDTAPAAAETQPTTNNQPAAEEETANPTEVQAETMNDQLTAQTRIPRDIKKQVADNAPPSASFGAAGTEGLGGSGAIGSVFRGQAQPMVKAAPNPVAISAGVATGMLIQKTTPIYPPIAKSAHVAGTVVLQATITKTGTIKDLHIASGPAMLRQAAVDAVRNWRYKPYKLNNQPTDVQTTINVIFSLGG